MKKLSKALFLVPALMLAGCAGMTKEDVISDIINSNGGGNGGGNNSGFSLSFSDSGHSAVEALSKQAGGVSIKFSFTHYVDDELTAGADVTLSRVNNIEWATVEAFYLDGENRVEQTIGGAIEIDEKDDLAVDAYYFDSEAKEYVYYGTAYDPDVKLLTETFTFEALESWLTLDNAYLAAAVAMGANGKIENIAGQQCLTFNLSGTANPGYGIPHDDSVSVSFNLSSRLLMKAHYTHFEYDIDGVPVVYQENVDVTSFTTAGEVPVLVKE